MAYYTGLDAPTCPWCKQGHYNHHSCEQIEKDKENRARKATEDKEQLAKLIAKELAELLKK